MATTRRWVVPAMATLLGGALLNHCSSASQGGEGQACYANGTCNAGLTCLSKLCVNAGGSPDGGSTDAGASDAGSTADSGTPDAGTPDAGSCPAPTSLPTFPSAPPNLFCPFSAPDGGGSYCGNNVGVTCCESGADAGVCMFQTCSAGQVNWSCEDTATHCGGALPVCCAPGATFVPGATGCANTATAFTGSACVATGACSGLQLCASDSSCSNGMTCHPTLILGNPVGVCQ